MDKSKLKSLFSKNRSGMFYILSGLFKTGVQTLSGFIILRWISPEDLGSWQSFTVFAIYLNIFTLGVPTGLNRELPYWLGKNENEKVIRFVQTAGSYVSRVSLTIILLTFIISLFLYFTKAVTGIFSLMLFAAFSKAVINMLGNVIGVTYRSNQSFKDLGKIQFILAWLQLGLIPIVYFFEIWGYIVYQILVVSLTYFGYYSKRPYKVNYQFHKTELVDLIKTGLPMFIWNYLGRTARTLPRLILVLVGSPVLVGLFSPAESLNKAVQNLPNYVNLFLFPKISFKYGQTDNKTLVVKKVIKASLLLFLVMLSISLILIIATPYLFELVFPKYIQSTTVVQIILLSGAFYSVTQLLHNTINSFKDFNFFKFLVPLRLLTTIVSIFSVKYFYDDILTSVALGALITEIIIMFSYIYVLRYRIK